MLLLLQSLYSATLIFSVVRICITNFSRVGGKLNIVIHFHRWLAISVLLVHEIVVLNTLNGHTSIKNLGLVLLFTYLLFFVVLYKTLSLAWLVFILFCDARLRFLFHWQALLKLFRFGGLCISWALAWCAIHFFNYDNFGYIPFNINSLTNSVSQFL